jgi:hypothetical protein
MYGEESNKALHLTSTGEVVFDQKFDGYVADKPLFEANRTPAAVPGWKPVVLTEEKK